MLALKLAVAGLLFWLIARNADMAAVWARLARIDQGAFALGVVAMFGFCVVMALRWRMLSAAAGQPIGGVRSGLLYLEALTFNLVLPGSVGGEVVRRAQDEHLWVRDCFVLRPGVFLRLPAFPPANRVGVALPDRVVLVREQVLGEFRPVRA